MAKRRRSKKTETTPGMLYLAILLTIIAVIGFFLYGAGQPRTPRVSNPPALATGRQTARPQSTPRPTATRVRSQSSGSQSSAPQRTCPENCAEAKAMGVSAEFAASCGLDRDADGVACYGD